MAQHKPKFTKNIIYETENFNNFVTIRNTEILDPFSESSGFRDYCESLKNLILKIFWVKIVFSMFVRAAGGIGILMFFVKFAVYWLKHPL